MNRLLGLISVGLVMTGLVGTPASADDRATCFSADGPPDPAIEACGRLIASGKFKNPDLAKVYLWRADAWSRKRDHDNAVADLNESIRLNPKIAIAYYNRGQSFSGRGELVRAIADFDAAIRLDRKFANAYVARGHVFRQQSQGDRAIADYSEAVRLNPRDHVAYASRGLAYWGKRDYDRAIQDGSEAIRLQPQSSAYYTQRGFFYDAKGELDNALADFRKAQALDPRDDRSLALIRRLEQQIASRNANSSAGPPPPADRPAAQAAAGPTTTPPSAPGSAQPERQPQASSPSAPNATPLTAPAATRPADVRVALIVGNGNYRHANRLYNPANDAADMAEVLRKLGFDVVEGRDLDKRSLEDKVREFGRKLDRANIALFFYAGHGIQVGGRNYLIPIDAKLERPGDLTFDTIDVSQVLAQMEAEQRVNLVFLDACRDNPLARSFASSLGTRSVSVGRGLATIQSALGTMISYATQPDAVALDGDGRNSPFTAALLKHLTTPGVEIGSVMKRVRADVVQATRGKQVPWDHSSLIGDVVLAQQ